eukprot:SAG22_NODE_588_length_8842_cov_33.853254_10_plen_57_part_01
MEPNTPTRGRLRAGGGGGGRVFSAVFGAGGPDRGHAAGGAEGVTPLPSSTSAPPPPP